jgi:hypothetical protein
MSALDDDIKVFGIVVHAVLQPIVAYGAADLFFQIRSNGVLTGIHMSDLRPFESLRKDFPRLLGDVICLADIQAPDMARWHL